ncbi:MAG: hypothetical protein JNM18_18690 [Planctomycetaceae bacterium]|nr:hypothetical protein [Planctomycetaceae bacterium]
MSRTSVRYRIGWSFVVFTCVVTAALPCGAQTASPAAPGKLDVPNTAAELNDAWPVEGRIEAQQLRPRRGQIVRPKGPGRATIAVTTGDWTIDADDVRFQSLEFVWEPPSGSVTAADNVPPALIHIRGRRVSFENCTFQGDGQRTVAVRWTPTIAALDSAPQLTLQQCLVRQVTAGIETVARGTMTIDCVDTLHVGPGPLVELRTLPTKGNTLAVALDHTTLRGARGLIATRQDYGDDRLGRLAVHAVDSVFAPTDRAALLQVTTEAEPPEWLSAISWTGQGGLVADTHPLMAWIDKAGHTHVVAENVIRASGLVRSRLRFEGEDLASLAASRLRDWAAPLRSLDPPGISSRHQASTPLIVPASGVE